MSTEDELRLFDRGGVVEMPRLKDGFGTSVIHTILTIKRYFWAGVVRIVSVFAGLSSKMVVADRLNLSC